MRPQNDRRRQLTTPVDADKYTILRIELEIEPGATVGDHPGGVQQLARRVGLAAVVIEEIRPGERCNWETTTRSVPLMTKVPFSVMSGISPMYTSCSLTSLTALLEDSLS